MTKIRTISTIEMHTGGEPFRIVTAGLPKLPGASIVARRRWCLENIDAVRRALMFEPRGHADMYGGYLTEAVTPRADFGIIFIHNEGYSDHCGHGTIALATAAVELGWVTPVVPETRVGIDAPCGFIEAFVEWDGARAGNVRFVNVPSFIWQRDVSVETSFGLVTGDICFGGAFYFYVDGRPFNLAIRPGNVETLIRFGAEVKAAANVKYPLAHPEVPELNHIYGTIIDGEPQHVGSDQANCCIFADRQVDRSPTGSGTAGRAAQLYFRGKLGLGESFINESIVGSTMRGKVLKLARVGPFEAIVPEVSGRAHRVGEAQWRIDPEDTLGAGFLVR